MSNVSQSELVYTIKFNTDEYTISRNGAHAVLLLYVDTREKSLEISFVAEKANFIPNACFMFPPYICISRT